MRGLLLALGVLVTTLLEAQFTGSDIPLQIGSGPNTAYLVIDFNNGEAPDSFAWAFSFSGTDVSGADMLLAIAAVDPNLTLDYGGSGSDGFFLNGISYQYSGETISQESEYPTASWGYYIAGGQADGQSVSIPGGVSYPVDWESAMVGASDMSFGTPGRLLGDGSWDYWSVGPYDTNTFAHLGSPSGSPAVAPIPEPTQILVGFASLLIAAAGIRLNRNCC